MSATDPSRDQSDALTMNDLFSREFMLQYSEFSSIQEFFLSSGFTICCQHDFDCIDRTKLDAFVAATTRFASWEEMITEATDEWALRNLDL